MVTTGLTNGRVANWAPEVAFSAFRAPSRRQLTVDSVAKSAYFTITVSAVFALMNSNILYLY